MARKSREEMRIVVLAGGISEEREISFSSGGNAAAALREAGYGRVELLDPAEDDFLARLAAGAFDAAFIALHGKGGEDGMIQSILEFMHIPYTGSDVIASASAADKDLSKIIYAHAGIPIAPGVALTRGDEVDIEEIVAVVGEKSFVKPAVNGSSYGVTLVKDPSELSHAIEVAYRYSDKVLVEKCIEGIEITVGVFGDEPRALPIVEIRRPEDCEFFDLRVKYISPDQIHRIPAQIPEHDYARAQELAVTAHRGLGCSGLSRSDFIVSEDGPIILETNTIPGMTDTSLFPDEVRHADMAFSDVCDALIRLALDRAGA